MGHLLGYARVSTADQQPHLQVDALERAGCYRVFTDTASDARSDGAADRAGPGPGARRRHPLVVGAFDWLGRLLRRLVGKPTSAMQPAEASTTNRLAGRLRSCRDNVRGG